MYSIQKAGQSFVMNSSSLGLRDFTEHGTPCTSCTARLLELDIAGKSKVSIWRPALRRRVALFAKV